MREVYARDHGQCTFVSADGKRCAERGFLKLHHVHAHARGSANTAANLKLACRSHDALFAERDFGKQFMQREQDGGCAEAKYVANNRSSFLERAQV